MTQQMTKRIDALTEEQIAQFGPWADQWIARGLSTERADWAAFESAARRCYALAGLPPPRVIVRCASPLVAMQAASIADQILASGGSMDDVSKMRPKPLGYCGGQFWLSWQARESFFHDVCGLDSGKRAEAEAYREAQSSACWWIPMRWGIMVSDRPTAIHTEQVGPRGWGSHQLHCDDGPAVVWPDGWGVYVVHGVRVDERVVMRPETITVQDIKDESNAEVRRIMRERYGDARYLRDIGAKLIHMDTVASDAVAPGREGITRALVEDDEGHRWLIGSDGSTPRVYVMRVADDASTCQGAHNSIAPIEEQKLGLQV